MSVAAHTQVLVPRQPQASVRRRRVLYAIADHSMAIALCFMFAVPLFIVVVTAFMPRSQVGTGQLIPDPVYYGNFHKVLTEIPFVRYLSNPKVVL